DAVGRTQRLGDDVLDTGHLEDGASGATGYHAGTRSSGLHQHATGARVADHRVDDGRAGEGHVKEVLARLFDALLHREAGFLGLAVAQANLAIAVTNHHEGGEGEPTTT